MALDVVSFKKLIKDSKKTQNEIAEQIGLTASQFSQKANGIRRFTVPEALKLAEVFDLSIEDLRQLWKGENE